VSLALNSSQVIMSTAVVPQIHIACIISSCCPLYLAYFIFLLIFSVSSGYTCDDVDSGDSDEWLAYFAVCCDKSTF